MLSSGDYSVSRTNSSPRPFSGLASAPANVTAPHRARHEGCGGGDHSLLMPTFDPVPKQLRPTRREENQSASRMTEGLVPGQLLGQTYRIIAPLAEGGMGRIYRAEHVRLGRPVAVKVLAGHLTSNPSALSRFRREAEIFSRLHHPHIVEILDYDTTPAGVPYIAMELLTGESLGHRLEREHRLSLNLAVAIVVQTATALALAHQVGIVHRDLKPDNVFLVSVDASSVFVKLLDFGISKLSASETHVTGEFDVLGTPGYIAPEQALSTTRTDHRADQYALATMTFEMLAGRLPYAATSPVELLRKVVQEPFDPLDQIMPDLPRRVVTAIHRALDKEPDRRFASVVEFAQALQAATDADGLAVSDGTRASSIPISRGTTPPDGCSPWRTTPPDGRPSALPSEPEDPSEREVTRRLRHRAPLRSGPAPVWATEAKARVSERPLRRTPVSEVPPTHTETVPAPEPNNLPASSSSVAAALIDEVRCAVAFGEHHRAINCARRLLWSVRNHADPEACALIRGASELLEPLFWELLGALERHPTWVRKPTSRDGLMPEEQRFVARCIQDHSTLRELVRTSPFGFAETARLVMELQDHGIMTLE